MSFYGTMFTPLEKLLHISRFLKQQESTTSEKLWTTTLKVI